MSALLKSLPQHPSETELGASQSQEIRSKTAASHHKLYESLASQLPSEQQIDESADFIRKSLNTCEADPDGLPFEPSELFGWMERNIQNVHGEYQRYLEQRKAGASRRYFANRSHAIYFLRQVAPTKLVDGSWLYGLCTYADNSRLSDLVLTYLEELGTGDADKNHVTLYRGLLSRYGIDSFDDLPDALYEQGLIQLALGWNAKDFLPEIVGFNLAYEQLPLHLLITAYELNELGIDPYYFTLHITVDNADTGHARRACQAALDAAPRIDDGGDYWRRVRAGAKLGNIGISTVNVIESFDLDTEVVRIFSRKSTAGHGAHSDFCKIGGRKVNDWLSNPEDIPAFLETLEQAGWILKGRPPAESRFWNLLQGDRAEMFGVFSSYELQVIYDWIRGKSNVDGASFESTSAPELAGTTTLPRRPISFRVAERLKAAKGFTKHPISDEALDVDLSLMRDQLPRLLPIEQRKMLIEAMSPALHWTPAGLFATKRFLQSAAVH